MPKLFKKKNKQEPADENIQSPDSGGVEESSRSPRKTKRFAMPDAKAIRSSMPDISSISLDTFRNLTIADIIAGGVAVFAVLVLIAMMMRNGASKSAYDAAIIENQGRMTQLQAELDELLGPQTEEDEEEVEVIPVHSALDAGAKLAQLQTGYLTKEKPKDGTNYYAEFGEAMWPYLTNEAQQISTGAWFPAWTDPSSTTQRVFYWGFESGYQFTGDSITGTWLCYRKYKSYNALVACALGTYTTSTGLFSDIHTVYVNNGVKELNMTDKYGYDILNEYYNLYGVLSQGTTEEGGTE